MAEQLFLSSAPALGLGVRLVNPDYATGAVLQVPGGDKKKDGIIPDSDRMINEIA